MTRCRIALLVVVAATVLLRAFAMANGDRNCLMCHKYPGLGRTEQADSGDNTIKHVFYVNEDLYDDSYHGKLRCKSCHEGVNKIPHTGVEKVNCGTDCHILDPSVNKPFSHAQIAADLERSAHGVKGSKKEHSEDLPTCKDCHTNKTYHAGIDKKVGAKNFLMVCHECHRSEEFTERFFDHMIYRATKRRSSKEVVRLCSKCHADEKLMTKHDLDPVIGFQDTFHAKAIAYGNEEVANCLNCHAAYQMGFSPHRITSGTDPVSPVSAENKLATCSQSGCHADANEAFAAGGRVHPSRVAMRRLARAPREEVTDELSSDTAFEAMVIGWIQLFYKVLIAAVVGGLGLHRLLDIYASRRERRTGGH
jgi:hypothetical protein